MVTSLDQIHAAIGRLQGQMEDTANARKETNAKLDHLVNQLTTVAVLADRLKELRDSTHDRFNHTHAVIARAEANFENKFDEFKKKITYHETSISKIENQYNVGETTRRVNFTWWHALYGLGISVVSIVIPIVLNRIWPLAVNGVH